MDPLVFEPYLRPMIWGGRSLEHRLDKKLPGEGPFGESWELSAHPHHVSRVAAGPLAGMSLVELWERRRAEIAGEDFRESAGFPWLIKFLDCSDWLSVQVHPDDAVARELLGNEMGKTEAWLVVDAQPRAKIYAGLKSGVTREDIERHLDAKTVAECLHSFTPQAGDGVFLPAGTVHSAGGGVLLAEVQQSSDATFRLFDWNRLAPDGKPRALHREEALRSIDWSAGPVRLIQPKPLFTSPGGAVVERLVQCPYFRVDRYRIVGETHFPRSAGMSVWMLIGGRAELRVNESEYCRQFGRGQTVLVPASSGPFVWVNSSMRPATLLAVTAAEPC